MAKPVREALIDAAYDAAVTTGWAQARMADIAAAAGVSRQTLYDQFGSRDGLAQAVAMRELERFLDGTEAALAPHRALPEAVEAATAYVLRAAQDNPLVHSLLTENGEAGLLPFVTTRAEPLLVVARDRLQRYFAAYYPELDLPDAQLVAEVCTRLTMSYVVLPAEPVDVTAHRVATLVARVLDHDHRSVR